MNRVEQVRAALPANLAALDEQPDGSKSFPVRYVRAIDLRPAERPTVFWYTPEG